MTAQHSATASGLPSRNQCKRVGRGFPIASPDTLQLDQGLDEAQDPNLDYSNLRITVARRARHKEVQEPVSRYATAQMLDLRRSRAKQSLILTVYCLMLCSDCVD
ncbi:MAG TPA: hypothetical protein PLW35_04270 [Verrucomicrobiota bacterium]|nr:hypothetical protein [Verrucomicrobiota bacterium]